MDNPPNHPKLDHFSIETYCMVLEIDLQETPMYYGEMLYETPFFMGCFLESSHESLRNSHKLA